MTALLFLSLLTAAGVCLGAGAVILTIRRRKYRHYLRYDPAQDCYSGLHGPKVEVTTLTPIQGGFVLRPPGAQVAGALFELHVQTTTCGAYFDPVLEMEAGDWRETFTVERGAKGRRLFNVTRLLSRSGESPLNIRLKGQRLTWSDERARLHVCRHTFSSEERVLIVSPHPDDAEIAAFGLYADSNAAIVTLTAGDNSDRYGSPAPLLQDLSRGQVAKMRVWESICIPRLGEIPEEKVLNLCFPDSRLSEMRASPSVDFARESESALDFAGLRRLNRSSLLRKTDCGEPLPCSWNTLVDDLKYILESIRPTIIVAPHPLLDSHPDHTTATKAIMEALETISSGEGHFFFYCVHNHRSELWPFGPAGAGVTHLPILRQNGVKASGLYSHQLSPARQTDKFIALEAMHDVREMEWPVSDSPETAAMALRGAFRWLAHGLGRTPTSYLRRAVRPDEPFFIVEFSQARKLIDALS
jgi:LmbE family N-acetylglucosaminyl deacetylase